MFLTRRSPDRTSSSETRLMPSRRSSNKSSTRRPIYSNARQEKTKRNWLILCVYTHTSETGGAHHSKTEKTGKKNKNKNVRSAGLTFRRHYSPIDAMIHGPFMQERWNTTNQNGILNCRRKKTANDRKASNWQDSPIYSPNAVLSALILFPPFYSLFITSVLLWGRAQHDGWWDDVSHPSVRLSVCECVAMFCSHHFTSWFDSQLSAPNGGDCALVWIINGRNLAVITWFPFFFPCFYFL